MRYKGICQCGIAAFEIKDEVTSEAAPGLSARPCRSVRLWTIPHDRLRLLGSEGNIGAYTFNETIVGHRFCGKCGMHLYGEQIGEQDDRMAYVNLDCIDQDLT